MYSLRGEGTVAIPPTEQDHSRAGVPAGVMSPGLQQSGRVLPGAVPERDAGPVGGVTAANCQPLHTVVNPLFCRHGGELTLLACGGYEDLHRVTRGIRGRPTTTRYDETLRRSRRYLATAGHWSCVTGGAERVSQEAAGEEDTGVGQQALGPVVPGVVAAVCVVGAELPTFSLHRHVGQQSNLGVRTELTFLNFTTETLGWSTMETIRNSALSRSLSRHRRWATHLSTKKHFYF